MRRMSIVDGPGERFGHRTGFRRVGWAILIASLAWANPVFADEYVGPQTYKLAAGDKISVTVFGQAELSREMLVDITGNIHIPFVGSIEVAGLNLTQCRERIVARLADGILHRPSVDVQIAELRPVFVIGNVRSAGLQPFRFGMNVKMALAVAGGVGTAPPVQGAAMADYLAIEERVRQVSLQRASLLVRKARLEAQRDGQATFNVPGHGAADSDLTEIVAIEKDILDWQIANRRSQLDILEAQRPRIMNEINALNGQVATKKKQIELVKQYTDRYSGLVKQGLGLANLEMQLKITESTYESEIWMLTANISRLQMDLGAMDIRIQETEAAFKRQNLVDLQDVQDKLKQVEVTLPILREIRQVRLQQSGAVIAADTPQSITVTRNRNGQLSQIKASDATPLEPGDIVEVQMPLPQNPTMSAETTWLGLGRTAPGRDSASLPVIGR